MNTRAWAVVAVALGILGVGCGSQKTETTPASAPGSPSSQATSSAPPSEAKASGFQPFTPATDPCSLVDPERLAPQGAAPIKAEVMDTVDGIQRCSYEEASGGEVLSVSLFKNSDGASNYRAIHVRILESEGAQIYVMKDEPDECGVGLVNPEDNIAKFVFEPSAAAVAAAALPAGQTWCDFSAPVIAEASKKLGWVK
ncbi:DUF3558 family protein [Mycobacterium sp. D16R24]|uniref:DUF3558 family protein n=1 Tax=Mycobacterium sp. D16R24 TaxID=1855656 RepID=UPI0009946762|nr:DUF3558 family protein [Mycobacterium sp. D16R24]